MKQDKTSNVISFDVLDDYQAEICKSLPDLYPDRGERQIVEDILVPQFRTLLDDVLHQFHQKEILKSDIPITPSQVSLLCERIDQAIERNKDLLTIEGLFKPILARISRVRERAKRELEKIFYDDCRNMLREKGIDGRDSFLTRGYHLFREKNFGKYQTGKLFFKLILGRSIDQISQQDLNEVADLLGFKDASKKDKQSSKVVEAGEATETPKSLANDITMAPEVIDVLTTLRDVNINSITGLEALALITELQQKIRAFYKENRQPQATVQEFLQRSLPSEVAETETALEAIVFDEVNLASIPFALLTRDTQGSYDIPLSEDGKSRVVTNSVEYTLPNSLAPRVLLGIMWMWKKEHRSGERTFKVGIRDLVTRYMYPDRFLTYGPNSELMASVEHQMRSIANIRIHTDKWPQKSEKRMDNGITIISDIEIIDEGGRHRPRVLQLTWGQPFWDSMMNNPTRSIDLKILQKLDSPLDLQLYRLLSHQLSYKPRQEYPNIVSFARYMLGMQGKTVEAGGRIASSYIVKKLEEAVSRLNKAGFKLRMTIDYTQVPFHVIFERI